MAKEDKKDVSVKEDADISVNNDVTTLASAAAATGKHKFNIKEFLKTRKGKVAAAIALVVLIAAIVFMVPASRYAVVGLVIKKDVHVELVDSITGKPVSSANVNFANQQAKTDANGHIVFKNVPVGNWSLAADKNYYEGVKANVFVPILRNPDSVKLVIVATGRQVPVSVVSKMTAAPLTNVEIIAGDSSAKTAENGEATLVLPADKLAVAATLKAEGYNESTVEITVTDQVDDKNKFTLTPSGKVYFLSKRTGKINVMSSNLDGSDQKVILEGTGKEDQFNTTLLASRDWKYLALHAKRDSDRAKLYLITTSDNKLTVMDEGNADFILRGWSNEYFVYSVLRLEVPLWQNDRVSLKSFNAATSKLTALDSTKGEGSSGTNWVSENLSNVYILNDRLIYTKHWDHYYLAQSLIAGKKDVIAAVKPSGADKQTLRNFDVTSASYIEARPYRPQEIYFRLGLPNNVIKYFEYEDGKVEETNAVTPESFYQNYITYLFSPSGKHTFWTEERDGKQALFVGDAHGANGKEISLGEYRAYGWYSDDYVLVSKGSSELFIMPVTSENKAPLKITDYHRAAGEYSGYGYGYGGL